MTSVETLSLRFRAPLQESNGLNWTSVSGISLASHTAFLGTHLCHSLALGDLAGSEPISEASVGSTIGLLF